MLIVGILLSALVLFIAIGLLSGPGDGAAAEFYGLLLPDASARTLFATGIVVALAGVLAGKLIATAVARRRTTDAAGSDAGEDA